MPGPPGMVHHTVKKTKNLDRCWHSSMVKPPVVFKHLLWRGLSERHANIINTITMFSLCTESHKQSETSGIHESSRCFSSSPGSNVVGPYLSTTCNSHNSVWSLAVTARLCLFILILVFQHQCCSQLTRCRLSDALHTSAPSVITYADSLCLKR